MLALTRLLPSLLIALSLSGLLRAQDGNVLSEKAREHLVEALTTWVQDYEEDRLSPRGVLRRERRLAPRYARHARQAGMLEPGHYGNLTHMDVLQKMLYTAEQDPGGDTARAILPLASAGFEKSVFDRDALQLRDLGHWTLMRMEHRGVWFYLLRAAAGNDLPFLRSRRTELDDAPRDVAAQVAAIKLLGQKDLPVFRPTVEGALLDADSRVRLAAAEALALMRRPESMGILVRAMSTERHPVVSQALVDAALANLKKNGADFSQEMRERAVMAGLERLGEVGWRTDMELVRLVQEFPTKPAIPALIGLLERTEHEPDQLIELVNRQASPILRDRAWSTLKGLTGAIIPADEPEEWRAFWETEKDNIVVPDRVGRERPGGSTRARFFGIPVTGQEIAFVIDTSGSMDSAASIATVSGGGRGRRNRDIPSRLEAAVEQILAAVQAMNSESHYHLFTFSDETLTWNKKPVPPNPDTTRTLTETLGKFRANGGTNIFNALAEALEFNELQFGEETQNPIDELFFLSDGEPTSGLVQDPEEILRLVREANKYQKVRINTVFTGVGSGADFLRKLAEQNDGVFVQR